MTNRIMKHLAVLLAAVAACMANAHAQTQPVEGKAPAARSIAITFDDLPAVSLVGKLDSSEAVATAKLLRTLQEMRVPAIGFVNEGKLDPSGNGKPDPQRLAVLRQWLDAGLELGNHTYSHQSFHKSSAEEFTADILRGEAQTRPLMAAYGKQLIKQS